MSETDPDLALVERLAANPTEESRRRFLFAHPQLLSDSFQQRVVARLESPGPANARSLRRAIKHAREIVDAIREGREIYPIGRGPLEALWNRVRVGEVTMAHALQLAAASDFSAMISPIYGESMSSWADELLSDPTSDTEALNILRLLGAAVHGGLPSSEASTELIQIRLGYDYGWIDQAGKYLVEHADGRVYRDALRAGERLLDSFIGEEWDEMRGKTFYRLGTLHLYPYTAGRSIQNFRAEHGRWIRRFLEERRDELAGLVDDQCLMPEPAEALALAEQHFRMAINLLAGSLLGSCLKDLAVTLEWQQGIGANTANFEEVRWLCHEAIRLTKSEGPIIHLTVLPILARFGEVISRDTIGDLMRELIRSADDLKHGTLTDMVYQATYLLGEIDPVSALAGAVSVREMYVDDPERVRVGFWELELKLIYEIWREWIGGDMPANKLLDKAKCLASGEDRERMPIRPVAEGLIALAVAAAHWGQHADGIVIVDGVVSGYPEFTEHYLNATTLLRAELRVGAAGKAFNAEDWANAIQLNAEAAEYHLSLGLIEQTMSCWARIHDLADRRGDPVGVVRETIRALQMLALPLEVELGDRGLTAVNALCNRILDNHGKGMGTDAAFVVCQIAKGLRFGSALRSGARYSWQKDEVGRRLLDQIGHAEAALRSEVRGSVEPAPDLLDENTILGAYVSTIEREPGATAQQRLANLQRSFDRRVSESLLLAASGQELPVYALERYQALLDERTVLAYLYLGVSEGLAAVYSFLLTREEVLSRCIPYVSGTMRVLTSNNRQAEFEMMSFSVGLLRKHLLQTPDGQRVSPEANELLEEGIDWFFGGSEVLEQLRAQGKDHLCIIPHGALHYLPFHLLGKGNVPLARQWTITYLPHPVLLFTDRVSRTSQHTAAQKSAVIGLEYRQVNPHGLPELPQSREELVEVATVLNVEPIFERDATESTVVDALTSARFVHLSMHGQHNVAAPAFQCLYTAQDKGEDGRLNAYELLSADLSRLHLVTLSACETALGRFDAGDNLRGLPAGLLLGGASCLIGTLWTVDAGASKFFFVALYTALNSGSTRLEAFSTAQRATRRRFPRYQDWGSFYLIGQWT